jgi:hypothetical protein
VAEALNPSGLDRLCTAVCRGAILAFLGAKIRTKSEHWMPYSPFLPFLPRRFRVEK